MFFFFCAHYGRMPLYTIPEIQASIASTKLAIEKSKRAIASQGGDVRIERERLEALRQQLEYEYSQLQQLDPSSHPPAEMFAGAELA